MNRIDAVFQRLRNEGRKAFLPFITAGDPNLDATLALIDELAARGASVIELGIPYSDPIADGPVIQASYTRALSRQLKLGEIFRRIGARPMRAGEPPLVAMVSYAIVLRHGLDAFVRDCQQAGLDGAIVPDLPVEESGDLAAIAARSDFKLVPLVTPTTPPDRAVRIARSATGFLYYVAVTGITGERTAINSSVIEQVAWLKKQTDVPVCIGFGISRPEHVRMLAPVADGIIVGSAIVRRVAEAADKPVEELAREVGDYVETLMDAMP